MRSHVTKLTAFLTLLALPFATSLKSEVRGPNPNRMRGSNVALGLALTLGVAPLSAQRPSTDEFEAAVSAAQSEAQALGLRLRTDARWLRNLRSRAPMMSALSAGDCHIVYNPDAPRVGSNDLFPPLTSGDREAWLGGVIRHELAHCADQQDRGSGADVPAVARDKGRGREVMGDLAFALHVARQAPEGRNLVVRLAEVRAAHGADDPEHDTASALRCYLADVNSAPRAEGTWVAMLRKWKRRCFDSEPVN